MTRSHPVVRLVRAVGRRAGFHPEDPDPPDLHLPDRRALVVATNHGVLDSGKPTGVFASELTSAYYAFLDADLSVDVASPRGGVVPVDPLSLRAVVRSAADDRFLADPHLRGKVMASRAVGEVSMKDYDLVYLAGGWGAAYDFGFSQALADQVTEADRLGLIIGGVCHGPLGLVSATARDGRPLVEGRRVTAVTDRQVRQLGIDHTPQHPETELRRRGARFESATRLTDVLANHWVVDGSLVTGQNQNAGPMVARAMLTLLADRDADPG